MELRKSRRCEGATAERQTHTFEHLAPENTPSISFALWTLAISSANAGSARLVGLTRGDIGVSGCHVERSRACLCQHRATLADINHAQGVDSAVSE